MYPQTGTPYSSRGLSPLENWIHAMHQHGGTDGEIIDDLTGNKPIILQDSHKPR